MADQRTMIEGYLDELGLSADWYVVEPVYGDITDTVWLQKEPSQAADVKDVRLYLPRRDLENLPPGEIKKRILEALLNVL